MTEKILLKDSKEKTEKPKQPKEPKPKDEIENPFIIEKNKKLFITKIETKLNPCRNCRKDLQENCKKDLSLGLEIEYYKPNNNCICIDEKGLSED